MTSHGGDDASAELLTLPVWHSAIPDGRGSRDFLAMIEGLRRMRQAGTITGVVATDKGYAVGAVMPRDAAMATQWQAIRRLPKA